MNKARLSVGIIFMGSVICCHAFDRIVVESCRKPELAAFAEDLARNHGKSLDYSPVAQKNAFNLGGDQFASGLVKLPSSLPKTWQYLQNLEGRTVVALGNDAFSIIHAALEMEDHLRWKTEPLKNFRLPHFRHFDNVFDDYALGFNRTADDFDLETHIRDTARTGLQTFEVNRLFEAIPIQVKNRRSWRDKYPWWCFYSAALDMFVESTLNRGTYPDEMLRGNLKEMKRCARLCRKYGMKPIIQVFEPRLWPESLFDKYPELRGARCDYATYSGEAEYSPDVNHPLVKQHYRELAENLLREVPDLDMIEVWSNDSCAAIPWSNRNYMGPNGPVLSRRRPVSESVISLLSSLAEGAHRVNPSCRIALDLSWFFGGSYLPEQADALGEAKAILSALPPQFDAAATQGYDRQHGSLHCEFADWGREKLSRNVRVLLENLSNPWKPFGPFQGLPFPESAATMLKLLKQRNTVDFTNRGGLTTAAFVPNFINNEVIRSFQYDGDAFDVEALLQSRARAWTKTPAQASLLRQLWKAGDDIYRSFDRSGGSWTSHFFVSGRTLFRHLISPQVPNPYLLSHEETAWYRPMEFHTGESDPSWYDISYYGYTQVMSDKTLVDLGRRAELLIGKTEAMLRLGEAVPDPGDACRDILGRMRIFLCMLRTDRHGVLNQEAIHRYLRSGSLQVREELRSIERDEMANVREFIEALESFSGVAIPVTSGEDNVYVIRAPLSHQLKLKLKVMQKHLNDEPGPVIEGSFVKSAVRPSQKP